MTFLPFILSSSVMTLTALDFLGFGLPPGSPSLGELLSQGKSNVQAPWLGLTGFFSIAIMLSLLDLHRRSGARRLRSTKDVPMSEPLLSIRDLSVAFGHGAREVLAVDHVSFDIGKGETVALVGESGSGKSVTALSVMKLLPYPAAHHPSGTVHFKGEELLSLPEDKIRHVRGNDITIIFQEPMTSLNPLHTIEKQIAEILLLHQGLTGEAARRRILELLTQVGIPDPQTRLGKLSASTLRRPAPARDDRHGAGERARFADRRRADHRARRDGAGANLEAAEGHANSGSACRCCSLPTISASCASSPSASASCSRARSSSRVRSSACSPRPSILTRARCSPPNRSPIRRRPSRTRRWWSRPRT